MQTNQKNGKPVTVVEKPILLGSWHGADAKQAAGKAMLSLLGVTAIYLILSLMFNFPSVILSVIANLAVVLVGFFFLRTSGIAKGEADAAYAEIMYERDKQGKPVEGEERARCFHPLKGWFVAGIAALPFFIVALGFAIFSSPSVFELGSLPGWTQGLMRQTEVSDALGYYVRTDGPRFMDIYRIVVRAMVMPFMSVATAISSEAQNIVERLSPLLVLVAPIGYAIGYSSGVKIREKINTGIVIGVRNKRRKQRRERQSRQRKQPEQLI